MNLWVYQYHHNQRFWRTAGLDQTCSWWSMIQGRWGQHNPKVALSKPQKWCFNFGVRSSLAFDGFFICAILFAIQLYGWIAKINLIHGNLIISSFSHFHFHFHLHFIKSIHRILHFKGHVLYKKAILVFIDTRFSFHKSDARQSCQCKMPCTAGMS